MVAYTYDLGKQKNGSVAMWFYIEDSTIDTFQESCLSLGQLSTMSIFCSQYVARFYMNVLEAYPFWRTVFPVA